LAARGDARPTGPDQRRAQFEERQLRELAHGRPLLIDWLLASQLLLEKRPAEARPYLERVAAAEYMDIDLSQRVAGGLVELGEMEEARELLESALEQDSENALVHAQLAGIHFRARRFDQAIASAVESLSLLYFQPGLHALLGQALMESKRFAEAERELLVAVSQSPRHIAAHELLAKLFREHLDRPADAFAHEGRARSLRHEMSELKRESVQLGRAFGPVRVAPPDAEDAGISRLTPPTAKPFGPEINPKQVITVVSGLPRSGTSLMMQLLAAAGREVLTDSKRAADKDNPLGYFEFEKSTELAKDASWLAQARGKVVKIVAQLLPNLPASEHYQIIFMERDLSEVIASQKAMLVRQNRHGAALEEQKLRETYSSQLQRVHSQLARRSEVRMLKVNYAALVADPICEVTALAKFIGEPFDCQAAARAVRPQLRRQNVAADV